MSIKTLNLRKNVWWMLYDGMGFLVFILFSRG